jgi:hypothetical protein
MTSQPSGKKGGDQQKKKQRFLVQKKSEKVKRRPQLDQRQEI